jgi:hypothetical protein
MHTYAADAQVFAVANFIDSHLTDFFANSVVKGSVNDSIWFNRSVRS